MNEQLRSRTILIISILFAAAFVIAFAIIAHAFVRTHTSDEVIHVTGSAQQPIRSDFIIWDSSITEQSTSMAAAYQALQTHGAKVRAYLAGKGIPEAEIVSSSVTTKTLYQREKGSDSSDGDGNQSDTFRQIAGYQLKEQFEVRSSNVDLVDAISRQSSELISSGVPFESDAPSYLYTKLSDLKVQMLAQAAKDARSRAEQIARSSGGELVAIRSAHMGVLQIEPLYSTSNSNEISDTGTNDTSSLDKKIIAVVTAEYAVR